MLITLGFKASELTEAKLHQSWEKGKLYASLTAWFKDDVCLSLTGSKKEIAEALELLVETLAEQPDFEQEAVDYEREKAIDLACGKL